MQRTLSYAHQSDEEKIKSAGLVLDFDEIARKGVMSPEEASVAKWYGIYRSRQAGDYMARVVIPGGRITSVQAKALAKLAEGYGPGLISWTTRQSVQLHKLKLADLAKFQREVKAVGLTTFHGCGDVARNVAACPWAIVCPHRRLNVLPYAERCARLLSGSRDLDNLPRKFKVTWSGCSGACAQPYINCMGMIGTARLVGAGVEAGFKVVIGGGQGWSPFVAKDLFAFVPAETAVGLTRAIGLLFRDHGDRTGRMYARLKYVVHRLGIEKVRELLLGYCAAEGIDTSGFLVEGVEDAGSPPPQRPLRENEPIGTDGLAIQRVMIPKGEMTAETLRRTGELAEMYGDKYVYSTNRQNLELHGVSPDRLGELRSQIEALGFQAERFFGLEDIVTCVGTKYCPLAVTYTHELFDRLSMLVRREAYAAVQGLALINITGCPNACSPVHIADIGLRGMRIRERTGSVESYRITLGGTQQAFGQVLGEYKLNDCERVVAAVLDTFAAAERAADEILADHVARVGLEPYRRAVEALGIQYDKAVLPRELSVEAGEGDHARDFRAIAKDVPCQEACPAKTNIPEYIRHIARGEFEQADRINREANVLPGVLGRVCTRPCEDRCRHQWTNLHGPTCICHLKRSAADRSQGPVVPLDIYSGPTGKRVAIVGGGPAGLAAGRELRRYGHEVVLLERLGYLGGQVRLGIPEFRLPRDVLARDIDGVLAHGLDVRMGQAVDAARIQDLLGEFDAVLIATGASVPRQLALPAMPERAGIEGLSFMQKFNDEEPLTVEADVIVIGGGFTAVDCARASRRLLGDKGNVSIYYRRGEAQMSATTEELRELAEEGIIVETLATPMEAVCEDGRLTGIRFGRNTLDPAGTGAKPRFVPVPGSSFVAGCRTVIFAIGQETDTQILPTGTRLTGPHGTTLDRLFVAGDFAGGNADVISAVADGKAAADEIDAALTGQPRRRQVLRVREAGPTGRLRDHDLVEPPPMPTLDPSRRGRSDEVEVGLGDRETDAHAWRCYLCNWKFEIDQDKCIHCDWCIRVSPRECILRAATLHIDADGVATAGEQVPQSQPENATYIWIDSDQCIRCGNCINICPTGAISLRKTDLVRCNRELPSGTTGRP